MRHPSSLALLLLAGTALHSAAANAGGIGLLGTGGIHQTRVYYYDADDTQYLNRQNRPNTGFGFEAVLGDKDDRFLGVARGYYMMDMPAVAPDAELVDDPIMAVPEGPTHLGMATVGVHWGVIGDPTGFQAHIVSAVGAGIVTVDSSTNEGSSQEFLLGEAGIGAHYHFARNLQIYADVTGGVRYRKLFSPVASGYLGFRYMFD
jgi:hypothetical protein